MQKVTICYFGTYRATYKHNREMINRLQMAGFEIIECHEPLWESEGERLSVAKGGWKKPLFWWRLVKTYWNLLKKHRYFKDYDVLVTAYPGVLDVYFARILSWKRKKPLVWDFLMSLQILAEERQLHESSRSIPVIIRLMEKCACRLADKIITDTNAYRQWLIEHYQIADDKFWHIPFGANDAIFKAEGKKIHTPDRHLILYYGGFVPNHGTPIIVEAARLLQSQNQITFKMIGEGPELDTCIGLARHYGLNNIQFQGWMGQQQLTEEIQKSAICLGSFASTPHGLLTIQNKIYECIACAKPVITGDSPAIREVFRHKENIYLVTRDSAAELAEAIVELVEHPQEREHIAKAGYQLFTEKFTNQAIQDIQKQYFLSLTG